MSPHLCYESLLARQSRGDGSETRNITHVDYNCDKVSVNEITTTTEIIPSNSGFIYKHTVMGGAGKGAELDPRKETNMQKHP